MKKLLANIFYTLCILSILWGIFSYIEIISKNTKPNPEYSEANLWVMIVEEAKQ